MKKLMVMVAIACSAVVASAATANWKTSASNIYNGTGSSDTTAKYTGTAYLFDAGVTSQAALYALIAAGTEITSSTAGYIETLNVANGGITATSFSYGEQSVSSSELSEYTYYFAIIDSDKVYFSTEKAVSANATATAKTVGFGNQATGSQSLPAGSGFQGAGAWSTTAVPEPTSGLLMLVGLAGLALRRRRA